MKIEIVNSPSLELGTLLLGDANGYPFECDTEVGVCDKFCGWPKPLDCASGNPAAPDGGNVEPYVLCGA